MTLFIGIFLSTFALLGIRNDKYKIITFFVIDFIFMFLANKFKWIDFWWFNIFIIPITALLIGMISSFFVDLTRNKGKEDKLATFIRKNYGLMSTDKMIEQMKITMVCMPYDKRGFYALLISYAYYNYKHDIENSVEYAKLAMDLVDARDTSDLILWYRWIAETKEIAQIVDNK